MPNKKEHMNTGAVSGLAVAGVVALCQENTPIEQIVETVGGLLGGTIGGRVADIIDVPTSPNHRSIAHGIVPNAVLSTHAPKIIECYNYLKSEAKRLAESDDPMDKVKSLLCIALAGALIGSIAGHISHLALDSKTTKSLPLLA